MNLIAKLFDDIQLLNELQQQYVDALEGRISSGEMAFNSIFGDATRIVLPMGGSAIWDELKQELTKIPNFVDIDVSKRELVRSIKTKTPDGREGIKEVKVPIGTAISKLKIDKEKKSRFLDFFSRYGSNIPDIEAEGKWKIILSRHPIDVARMSDMGNIHSCHSQGGDYFKCALQEGKGGGAVAYLVYSQKMEEVDTSSDEWKKGEIFADHDRAISGITPVARLRVRRYVNKPQENQKPLDLAIPETRIYGIQTAGGFWATVKDFLLAKQKHDIDAAGGVKAINQLFNGRDLWRRGGTYSDSSDSSLFNAFFDTVTFRGSVNHWSSDESEEEEIESSADILEAELGPIMIEANNDLEHSSIHYDISDDDEHAYYDASAVLKIDCSNLQISDDLDLDDDNAWDNNYSALSKAKDAYQVNERPDSEDMLASFAYTFVAYAKKSSLKNDLDEFVGFTYNKSTKNFNFYYCFGDDCSGYSHDADDFSNLAYTVKRFESKYYDVIYQIINKALHSIGKLRKTTGTSKTPLMDAYIDNEASFFNNIKDDDEGEFDYALRVTFPARLNKMVSTGMYGDKVEKYIATNLPAIIKRFQDSYVRQSQNTKQNIEYWKSRQTTFKDFNESYNPEGGISKMNMVVNLHAIKGNSIVITFKPESINEETLQFLKFLDGIPNELRAAINTLLSNMPDYSEIAQGGK